MKWHLFFIASSLALSPLSADKHYYHYQAEGKTEGFDLVDPQSAPISCKEEVMQGYSILRDTYNQMPDFCGNMMKCTNCHFCAGNTLGGKNGGIPLVGVTEKYPKYFERSKKTIDLGERIQNCFERSMNGKAPPLDSKEMQAIETYLKWISYEVKGQKSQPWLGLKLIELDYKPDETQGALIYSQDCASCHMANGEGSQEAPPLWGAKSFNDGAGLANLKPLASFIYYNMPLGIGCSLTKEEAFDVASFILTHPRPHFKKSK